MLTSFEQLIVKFDSISWENVGPGVRRKIMSYGDSLMAVYVEFKKDAIGPRHSHPHVQISFVHSGSFAVQIGEERRVLRAGDFFYVPSNIEHGGQAVEDCVLIDIFSPMRSEFLPSANSAALENSSAANSTQPPKNGS